MFEAKSEHHWSRVCSDCRRTFGIHFSLKKLHVAVDPPLSGAENAVNGKLSESKVLASQLKPKPEELTVGTVKGCT